MSHGARPVEQLLAFAVEVAAAAAVVDRGLRFDGGLARLGAAVLLPLTVATAWAVFRVPGDGGRPVVAVAGRTRLALEGAVLAGATAALLSSGRLALVPGWLGLVALRLVTGRERFRRLFARAR